MQDNFKTLALPHCPCQKALLNSHFYFPLHSTYLPALLLNYECIYLAEHMWMSSNSVNGNLFVGGWVICLIWGTSTSKFIPHVAHSILALSLRIFGQYILVTFRELLSTQICWGLLFAVANHKNKSGIPRTCATLYYIIFTSICQRLQNSLESLIYCIKSYIIFTRMFQTF